TEKEAADALRKARSNQEGFITAKDMEAFRKAQQEPAATLERVLVKLGLCTEQDIAGAYAEYLHLPIARTVSSNFGDITIELFGKEHGITNDLLAELMREQEAIRISGKPQPLLGELLIQRDLLTEEQVKTILEKQQELSKREGELVHDADCPKMLPEKF